MSDVRWVLEVVDAASAPSRKIASALEDVKTGGAKASSGLSSFAGAARSTMAGTVTAVSSAVSAVIELGRTIADIAGKALDAGKLVIDAVEFKRTTLASLKYLEGTQSAAESTFEDLRKMATAGGLPIEQVSQFYRDLRRAGYAAREVQNIVAAGADASIIFGDAKAGEELLKAIQKIKVTGKAELAEFGKVFPIGELKKNLSEATGLSDEAFAAMLSSGAINRDRLVSAILATVQKMGGAGALGAVALKDASESVTKQLLTLKDRALGLLADTAVTGPLLDALKNLGTFFDTSTEQGRRLRDALAAAFQQIGKWIGSITLDDMIGGFRTVANVVETVVDVVRAVWQVAVGAWEAFSAAVAPVVEIVKQLVAALGLDDVNGAGIAWRDVGKAIGWVLGRVVAIAQPLLAVLGFLTRITGEIMDGIGPAVQSIGTWLSDLGSGIESISSMISGFATHVASSVAETIGKVGDAIASWLSGAWQAGVDFVTGLWEGIKSKWAELKDWVASAASGVVDTFKSVLKIRSPSQVMAGIGEDTMAGFGVGLEDGAANTNDAAAEASRGVVDSVSGSRGGGRGGGVVINVTINVEGGEDAEDTAGRIATALRPELAALLDELELGAA